MADMSELLKVVNWRGLSNELGELAAEALAGRNGLAASLLTEGRVALTPIVTGAYEDVRTFALLIAQDMVAAHMANDLKWQAELNAQIRTLAERTRIRVEEAKWVFVERTFTVLFRASLAALGNVKLT